MKPTCLQNRASPVSFRIDHPIVSPGESNQIRIDVVIARIIQSPVFLVILMLSHTFWCYAAEDDKKLGVSGGSEVYTFAPLEDWRQLTPSNVSKQYTMADIVAVEDDIFAVGSDGGFYRVSERGLDRLLPAVDAHLTVVWAKAANEVYAGSANGEVFLYNGKSVRLLGKPIRTVKRLERPGRDPRDTPVHLKHIWASSSNDVYAAARGTYRGEGILIHYDGKEWRDISFGRIEVIVPTPSVKAWAIARTSFGPIWGHSQEQVWVAKRKLPQGIIPSQRGLRTRGSRIRLPLVRKIHDKTTVESWPVWQLDGDSWKNTGVSLPGEPSSRLGRGPSWPEEVLLSAKRYVARFENTLHVWSEDKWETVVKLPSIPSGQYWYTWTACSDNRFLIRLAAGAGHPRDGWQLYFRRQWIHIVDPHPPLRGTARLMVMTNDGKVGLLAYKTKTVHVGRIRLDKIHSVAEHDKKNKQLDE